MSVIISLGERIVSEGFDEASAKRSLVPQRHATLFTPAAFEA